MDTCVFKEHTFNIYVILHVNIAPLHDWPDYIGVTYQMYMSYERKWNTSHQCDSSNGYSSGNNPSSHHSQPRAERVAKNT